MPDIALPSATICNSTTS